MANYHLEVKAISRGKSHSVTGRVNYISGEKLYDSYTGRTYYRKRHDILYGRIFLPDNAPLSFLNLQTMCTEIENSEKRYDARTAREFIGSLPNELSYEEQCQIIDNYIGENFTAYGLGAIAAFHEGRNKSDPTRNNPHVHIIVTTRTIGPDGFSRKKDREHDRRKYINIWREQWATVQNRAYERAGYDKRVSHESLEVQGERDREPTIHLSRIDWNREQSGERTPAGDKKRAIQKRNEERARNKKLKRERQLERER